MLRRALFIGRFQPFHKGHLLAVKKLLTEYNEVILVLGSAEEKPSSTNPFSASERIEMIRSCFSKKDLARIMLIPVRDINDHAKWVAHVSSYVPSFECVYSNNELVNSLYKQKGIPAREFGFFNRELYEGKKIRDCIREGKKLEKYVPKTVAALIEKFGGSRRLGSAI